MKISTDIDYSLEEEICYLLFFLIPGWRSYRQKLKGYKTIDICRCRLKKTIDKILHCTVCKCNEFLKYYTTVTTYTLLILNIIT